MNTMNTSNLQQDTKLNYFIYCRKSSDTEDKQMLSLPAQVRELTKYAQDHNLTVVDVYQESRTAFKVGRPLFNEMMQRIDNGEANGVLVWQANRVSRNALDGGLFIYYMSEGKIVELRTPGKSYTILSDRFQLQIELIMAQKDSDDKSESVKRGNREKFFQKKDWLGVAKPGYLNYMNPMTKEKTIIDDPERFALIQKAGSMVINGELTPMQALAKLNDEWGFRTRRTAKQGGRPMGKSMWYRILGDPYYYGLMKRKEGETEGRHNPMFTKEDFKLLQVRLGRTGNNTTTFHNFPYKPAIKCGECNGSITAEEKWQIICSNCKVKFHKGKQRDRCPECNILIEEMVKPKILHYIYFRCTKKVNRNCSQGSIEYDELEKQIDEEIEKFTIPKEFVIWAIKHLNEENTQEVTDRETIKITLQNAIDDVTKQLDGLLTLKISPTNISGELLSDTEYAAKKKPLLAGKEDLLDQLNRLSERQNKWMELSERTFNFACQARYWLSFGTLIEKTQVLDALGSNIVLRDKNLLIERHKPYFLIEKGLNEAREIAKRLEPAKEVDLSVQIAYLEPVSSAWLRSRDSNPNFRGQNPACYHYTTPHRRSSKLVEE